MGQFRLEGVAILNGFKPPSVFSSLCCICMINTSTPPSPSTRSSRPSLQTDRCLFRKAPNGHENPFVSIDDWILFLAKKQLPHSAEHFYPWFMSNHEASCINLSDQVCQFMPIGNFSEACKTKQVNKLSITLTTMSALHEAFKARNAFWLGITWFSLNFFRRFMCLVVVASTLSLNAQKLKRKSRLARNLLEKL